jgi:hypothetical protein
VKVPAAFEWAGEGGFILQIIGSDGLPVARWMIDATTHLAPSLCCMPMRLSDEFCARHLENLARCSGFHQRFAGRLSPDRKSIEAWWEKSEDGMNWETDFDLHYAKIE